MEWGFAWERQPDEPALWFERFCTFRELGVQRSVDRAYRTLAATQGLTGERAGQAWRQAAQRYQWQARAEAWDQWKRDEAERIEGGRRFEAQQNRRAIIDQLLLAVMKALAIADLPHMAVADARLALPSLRMMMKDLLAADRLESGEVRWIVDARRLEQIAGDEDGEHHGIHAEEVVRAMRELEVWQRGAGTSQGRALSAEGSPVAGGVLSAAAASLQETAFVAPRLLVVVGADPALAVDVAMLRGVKRETGLDFHVIRNATRNDVDSYLRRERGNARPVIWMHIAAHACHEGVHFADGLADGDWLSARLLGVEVLLIAACDGDRLGDWLKVVQYVVTVDDEIGHGDAAQLTRHFWTNLAGGMGPDEALERALERCPPVVGESVVRHW